MYIKFHLVGVLRHLLNNVDGGTLLLGRIKRVFGFCFKIFFLSQKSFTLCFLSLEPFDQISFGGVLRPFLKIVDGGTLLLGRIKRVFGFCFKILFFRKYPSPSAPSRLNPLTKFHLVGFCVLFLKLSTGGLEPPRISPHAPQTCTSTIPPRRLTFFVFYLIFIYILNSKSMNRTYFVSFRCICIIIF